MEENEDSLKISNKEIEDCIRILESLNADTQQIFDITKDKRTALIKAAGILSRPSKDELYRRKKAAKKAIRSKIKEKDKQARKNTGIRSAREATIFVAPQMIALTGKETEKEIPLESPRNCYVCKSIYHYMHHFYDSMCKECGDFNYAKRFQKADLKGQVALVTGSRLKIGYHITIMMLKAGATVIATTRFPIDAAIRYAKEPDFYEWGHRLKIHGLDLRHIPSVELFCNYIIQKYERLDVLINNAAQTVRRPAGFYKHLMAKESTEVTDLPITVQELLNDHQYCINELNSLSSKLPEGQSKNLPVNWQAKIIGLGIVSSAELSQVPYSIDHSIITKEVFPEGELDADLQQVDLRKTNSWRLRLGEINTDEMLEVQFGDGGEDGADTEGIGIR